MSSSTDITALSNALRRTAEGISRQELPVLIGMLEEAKAALWARLSTPQPTPAPPPQSRLISAEEMAEQLSIKKSWLLERARQGDIPSVKVGHYRRFDPRQVLEALQQLSDK